MKGRAPTGLALGAAVVMLAGVGCGLEGPEDPARPTSEVYAAVLEQVVLAEGWGGHPSTHETRPIEHLVVLAEGWPYAPRTVSPYARERLEGLESATARDFEAQAGRAEVQGALEGVGDYTLLTPEIAETVLARAWDSFYEIFPGAPGYVGFSGVGFSAYGDQALVYMQHQREGLWGHGTLYLLTRRDGDWVIADRVLLSES